MRDGYRCISPHPYNSTYRVLDVALRVLCYHHLCFPLRAFYHVRSIVAHSMLTTWHDV